MIESFGKFIYRVPGFSFDTLQKECNMDQVDSYLETFFSDERFLSAVNLASKDFYEEIMRFKNHHEFSKKDLRKFRESAIKYISRMCCRPTPFGLFSGCGIGSVGSEDRIEPREGLESRVRLDMGFLTSVAEYLLSHEKLRRYLKFFRNNSIYNLGGKYRYVEYKVTNGERLYNLSSVEENEVLKDILKRSEHGVYFSDILKHLSSEYSEDEVLSYFNELVDSKVLISEFEPFMTGVEYETQFVELISRTLSQGIEEPDLKLLLEEVSAILNFYSTLVHQIETEHRNPTSEEIIVLTEKLKLLPNKYKVKDFIQSDCFAASNEAVLSEQTVKEIIESVEMMTRLSISSRSRLDDFKNSFLKRYESQVVPLSEVLDPEAGIGYGMTKNELLDYTPFVDSMPVGRSKKKTGETQLNWRNEVQGMFYNKIQAFKAGGSTGSPGIQITASDLEALPKHIDKLPPTLNAVVSVYQDGPGKKWIEFKKVGSSSACCLLGRFGYMTPAMNELLTEIASYESQFYVNKVVAEINHLSDIRVGNVLQRPQMRKFEISYVTKSNTSEQNKIEISDLYLTYKNGNLLLISKSLGKEVVPRLSNAHNFYKDTLPVYKFLSDLQDADVNGGYISIGVDVGPMYNFFDSIPRIYYKNSILQLAHWYLKPTDFKRLLGEKESDLDLQDKFIALFEKKNIPTRFLFVEGDFDIFVDLKNFLSFSNFVRDIKNKTLVVMKEALMEETQSLVRNSSGQYFHEIILPLKRSRPEVTNATGVELKKIIENLHQSKQADVKRRFSPGEEWLYFKVYAGIKVCDEILTNDLYQVLAQLKGTQMISNWFFIRYQDDGGPHLRIRLQLTDVKHCGEIMVQFSKTFESRMRNGIIKSIVMDTYERELERYGHDLISPAEQIFGIDSIFIIDTLRTTRSIGKDEYRWLFCLATMYTYLKAFKFTESRSYSFVKLARDHFGEEFNVDKMQKRYFITKYGTLKETIEAFFTEKRIGEDSHEWFFVRLNEFEVRLSSIYEKYYSDLRPEDQENYLRSFIHMSNVRFFSSKNRMHEYSLYCLIEQYYKYKIAREMHMKVQA